MTPHPVTSHRLRADLFLSTLHMLVRNDDISSLHSTTHTPYDSACCVKKVFERFLLTISIEVYNTRSLLFT